MNPDEFASHAAAMVESSDDAIISETLDGTILTWNGGAQNVYGYSAEDAIGRPISVLLPADRPDEEALILDRIKRGERVHHFETIRRKRNGDLIQVSLTISPVRDKKGTIIGASHVARDISNRVALESQLRHFSAIVESSDDAIVSKDLRGCVQSWNPAAEHLYGYSAAQMIGQSMALLLPDDRPNEEAEILHRVARGERVNHFETVRRTRNGELVDVSLLISPIRESGGTVVGASHVARDITEKKRLSQHLLHTQKLESLGVLAGGMAHDFNNLLTGIMGNASLAYEMLPANSPLRKALADVLKASENAAHLTRQMLAYAGKGRFAVEPVNLSVLVREISSLVQASIPKHVQLRLELRDDVPFIEADRSQLQQVIMNLVINGAEAIGNEDNGTVLVTTGAQAVDEQYLLTTFGDAEVPPGNYVSLQVHDTGCGMDEVVLARIFDPFFTTKFTGRGLGLSAVQGIVRGHKGMMKIYSSPGKGTTFKILLPASAESPQSEYIPLPVVANRDQLILIIDDEEIIRRTAKQILEQSGYTVVLAENGKEGVELFQILGTKVSAVILDLTMPVLSGEDAFSQIRVINPAARVILSSGFDEIEAVRRFAGKGIYSFLHKPFTVPMLLEKVTKALA